MLSEEANVADLKATDLLLRSKHLCASINRSIVYSVCLHNASDMYAKLKIAAGQSGPLALFRAIFYNNHPKI